jgi:gluconate 2-dehydrogenase gamma chain
MTFMKDDRDETAPSARRSFLTSAGATLGLVGAAAGPVSALAQAQSAPAPASAAPAVPAPAPAAAGYQSLSLEESAATEALVEHMWPADQFGPSGVDIGVATYIDRQLAGAFGSGDRLYSQGPFRAGKPQHGYQLPLTPEAWFKTGIAALNAWCSRSHGKSFDRLATADREAALQEVVGGKANAPGFDLAAWFNELFYPLFTQGAFADPIYGGNRGKAAWKMIGFPGLPAVYNRDIVTFRGKRNPKSDAPKSIQDLS